MQITDILASAQGGALARNLARQFDIEPEEAEAAIGALLPRLTDRMERNTLSRGGLADLVSMLGAGDRSRYLEDPNVLGAPELVADGNRILEMTLGSKDTSRKVAARAARETGLSDTLLRQLLPVVAAVTMSGLAKGAGGALGEVMKQLGGSPLPLPGEARSGGSTGDYAPRTAPSRPSLPQGKSPLPIPGDDLPGLGRRSGGGYNPLDDLSDILRRGGRGGGIELPRTQRPRIDIPDGGGTRIEIPTGGGLWGIIRSILGSVLGFESKGFLGWLIRLIVLKWGVGFLKRILTRMLRGR